MASAIQMANNVRNRSINIHSSADGNHSFPQRCELHIPAIAPDNRKEELGFLVLTSRSVRMMSHQSNAAVPVIILKTNS
ncbi:hypothetical protein TorRG33x02_027840 [Trema orientale]|uniref:Uncharacterized protein n=1 Tax=Trema orientale TaxID=63057 RepID=A0A2P5FUR0_TREOI|nr:hypothetical protein TorRG33x02_027840 [Trema orientale]